MEIHLEADIPAPPARVYELFSNGVKVGEATRKAGKGGGAAGAASSLFDGWLEGRQIELVPDERVVQAWRFQNWELECRDLDEAVQWAAMIPNATRGSVELRPLIEM